MLDDITCVTKPHVACPKCDHADAGVQPRPSLLRSILGLAPAKPSCPGMSEGYLEGGGWGDGLCNCTHEFHSVGSVALR